MSKITINFGIKKQQEFSLTVYLLLYLTVVLFCLIERRIIYYKNLELHCCFKTISLKHTIDNLVKGPCLHIVKFGTSPWKPPQYSYLISKKPLLIINPQLCNYIIFLFLINVLHTKIIAYLIFLYNTLIT